jgi:hypothetical protein
VILGIAVVRGDVLQKSNAAWVCSWSPTLIGVGLLLLFASVSWPMTPVMTGMALIGLGATGATIERFRRSPAFVPVLVTHLAIYGGLYALFVGASLHAATQSDAGIGLSAAIDLAASLGPAAVAVGLVGDVLRDSRSAE